MPYLIMKIEQLHPYKQIWKHSFSSNVNAVILSQTETKATEGEFLTSLLFALCKKCLTSTRPPYYPTKY
ncbi:hypothetical protein [uncultured Helicobacter sp.]|uniref:hypothetical protein n=1 Tax=uncultured Helicobacter sp. TaxID=175537 RepID=UPI00261EB105|nr:hypothetical protein [uncultured Helicobacter sp.]